MHTQYFIYPFIYQWTFKLLPFLGYCEQYSYECECANTFVCLYSDLYNVKCCKRAELCIESIQLNKCLFINKLIYNLNLL
jgi:hypothetical protein